MMPARPLILTLRLDPKTHATLTTLRAKYFPKSRNHLEAHITLFHTIPGHRRAEVDRHLHEICASQRGWEVFVGEPSRMGKGGVMLRVRQRPGGTVESVHRDLQSRLMDRQRWTRGDEDALTEQDQRSMGRPHITVLNKARTPEEVDTCLEEVIHTFESMKQPGEKVGQIHGTAVGFQLYVLLLLNWKG